MREIERGSDAKSAVLFLLFDLSRRSSSRLVPEMLAGVCTPRCSFPMWSLNCLKKQKERKFRKERNVNISRIRNPCLLHSFFKIEYIPPSLVTSFLSLCVGSFRLFFFFFSFFSCDCWERRIDLLSSFTGLSSFFEELFIQTFLIRSPWQSDRNTEKRKKKRVEEETTALRSLGVKLLLLF